MDPIRIIGIYRMSVIENEEIKKQLQELIEKCFIRPSSSPCGSPIILVPKKDGTWRMCVDFRSLNKITIKNRYPLPMIDDLLDQLKNDVYFTKLDLRNGYHQIHIAKNDIWKTAFKTRQRLFEWLVIPFGLCNAPTTFMWVMNDVFRPYIDKFVIIYLDDILIFSSIMKSMLGMLRKCLKCCTGKNCTLNFPNVSLGKLHRIILVT